MSETATSDAAATPEAPEQNAKSEPREYVVLEEVDHPATVHGKEHYVVHSRVVALSKDEAIRKAFATQSGSEKAGEQTFVAVTARSFQSKKVSTKTTTQLVLS